MTTDPTLEDFLRRAERALLAAAYGDSLASDPDDPEALSPALALTGEPVAALLDARLGPDARVLVLGELDRLARAGVGPPERPIRLGGALWGEVLAAALATGPLQVDAVRAWRPELVHRLGALPTGVAVRRLAASHRGVARFEAEPAPVDGAPGWVLRATAEPTLDGDWLVVVERRWLGAGDPPEPPAVAFVAGGLANGPQALPPGRDRWTGYAPEVRAGAVHAWISPRTADPST